MDFVHLDDIIVMFGPLRRARDTMPGGNSMNGMAQIKPDGSGMF
jgi:hypothetical protein